jgi:hypothetical protein
MKQEVTRKKEKKIFKISNMERLDNKELDKVIQEEDWASCVYHTAEIQENDYAKELYVTKFWSLSSSAYKTVR